MKPLLIQVTIAKEQEGRDLAKLLVERGLAVCVQQISGVESTYRWQGKVFQEMEYLLLIKSSEEKWEEIQTVIRANHSYECPEIVAISPLEVEKNYLSWWNESLRIQ